MSTVKYVTPLARKVGAMPGTLADTGHDTDFLVIDYSPSSHEESVVSAIQELPEQQHKVRWIRSGTGSVSLEEIGRAFHIHPLVLEDIQNHGQRPKIEDYGDYAYVVMQTADVTAESSIEFDNINMILGSHWIITFDNLDDAYYEPILERIKTCKGKLCNHGSDYLCYTIIDLIIDHYFLVLEQVGERIEGVEEKIVLHPLPELLHKIKLLKTQMLLFRRAVWPVRDMLSCIERGEACSFTDETLLYLRDAQDHIIQIIDTVETYRDIISGSLDIYLSSISFKLNEVMKLLTIISTIFIPITFISSVYGMNFKIMPELEWEYGYYATLGLMAMIAVGMLVFFRKKQWL